MHPPRATATASPIAARGRCIPMPIAALMRTSDAHTFARIITGRIGTTEVSFATANEHQNDARLELSLTGPIVGGERFPSTCRSYEATKGLALCTSLAKVFWSFCLLVSLQAGSPAKLSRAAASV